MSVVDQTYLASNDLETQAMLATLREGRATNPTVYYPQVHLNPNFMQLGLAISTTPGEWLSFDPLAVHFLPPPLPKQPPNPSSLFMLNPPQNLN